MSCFTAAFRCWDLIDSHATQVIHSKAFLKLSSKRVTEIVERDSLNVEETELYERAIEWALAQLQK